MREQRKAAGRCITCGGETEPGSANCRTCNDRAAVWYKERKTAGLCVTCDNAAVPGKTKCDACARTDVEQMQELYQQRKAAGLCVSCGGPPLLGQVLCADSLKGGGKWRFSIAVAEMHTNHHFCMIKARDEQRLTESRRSIAAEHAMDGR